MTDTVFISHAGADWRQVLEITKRLEAAGLHLLLDREELDLGDSFISFMEQSLHNANYCLLLWSVAAACSPWVKVEWESAFHRAVTESQRFLIVGLLDANPVPELLRPRLQVGFFPDPSTGINRLLELLHGDRDAEEASRRPVCAPRAILPEDPFGINVYISSELFGRTFPWRVNSTLPAAVAVEHLVTALDLPRQIDHNTKVGLRFRYQLARGDQALESDQPLAAQGVKENNLLWLLTEMLPFAASVPLSGNLGRGLFRNLNSIPSWGTAVLTARAKLLGLD